jgi:hypothetical protein
MPAERADRKIVTDMKNSAHPQSPNKRRKLIRLYELNVLKANSRNNFETIRIGYN